VAEVVDVLLVGNSSEVLPVPPPTRLDFDEAGLESTSEAVPHTKYPPFSVVSVIGVQPFGSIVFPSPVAVSVGRFVSKATTCASSRFALVGYSDGRRGLGDRRAI